MRRRFVGRVLILWLALASSAVRAEPSIITLVSETFNESLLDKPVVAGNLLVGLNWLGASGPFDPSRVSVDPQPDGVTRSACVSVSTEDGRYSSNNLFRIPAAITAPATFEQKTKLRATLLTYEVARIGIVVRTATSCNDPRPGPILPARLHPRDGSDRTLVAKINAAPADLAIAIELPGGATRTGTCRLPPEGVKVAFGAECTVKLPAIPVAGAYPLKITLQELFSTDSTTFQVWLTP